MHFVSWNARYSARLPQALLALLCLFPGSSAGHDYASDFSIRQITFTVGIRYIDIEIESYLLGVGASGERVALDTDRNGSISREEEERYVDGLALQALQNLELILVTPDGRDRIPVPLLTLYQTEIDFLNSRRVGDHPLKLRHFLFAPTPEAMEANGVLVLRVYPHATMSTITGFVAAGRGGTRASALRNAKTGGDGSDVRVYSVSIDRLGSRQPTEALELHPRVEAGVSEFSHEK